MPASLLYFYAGPVIGADKSGRTCSSYHLPRFSCGVGSSKSSYRQTKDNQQYPGSFFHATLANSINLLLTRRPSSAPRIPPDGRPRAGSTMPVRIVIAIISAVTHGNMSSGAPAAKGSTLRGTLPCPSSASRPRLFSIVVTIGIFVMASPRHFPRFVDPVALSETENRSFTGEIPMPCLVSPL